jgi:hypothetical protein
MIKLLDRCGREGRVEVFDSCLGLLPAVYLLKTVFYSWAKVFFREVLAGFGRRLFAEPIATLSWGSRKF